MNKGIRIFIGFLVIGLAFGGAVKMVKSKPKAERKKMSAMIPVVTVESISTETLPVKIEVLGKVISDVDVSLRAEVSGTILSTYPDLVEGSFVKQGDLLFEIDPKNYELKVLQSEATLKSAVSEFRLEEGQRAVAADEIMLLGDRASGNEAYMDIMLREPQLQAAESAVASARSALAAAKLDLERVKVKAPFDAVVVTADKNTGDYAQAGESLVELMSTRRLFVRCSLPVGDLKYFPGLDAGGYPAQLSLSDGQLMEGTVYKLLPKLSEQGRMAQVLIAVEDPFGEAVSRPLLIDEMVTAELSGIEMENVLELDRRYLRAGSVLWMLDDQSHLHMVPVEVLQGYATRVMVRYEAPEDWKLVTSNISAPVEGMTMKAVGAAPQRGAE